MTDVGSQQHFSNAHCRSLKPAPHGIMFGSATAINNLKIEKFETK